MAQPNPQAAVITAIQLAEESGRAMTDTEVAALAAGVLELDDLTGIVGPMIQSDGEEGSGSEKPGESDDDIATSDDDEEEEEEEEEEADKKEESKDNEERSPDEPAGAMEVDGEQNNGDSEANGEGKAELVSNGAGSEIDLGAGAGKGEAAGEAENVHEAQGGVSSQESSDESSSSDSSDGETIPERNWNKKKPAKCPVSGPLAVLHAGDISDGEDEDGFGAGVPMTKNEAEEPILPLGEVTMDGAEVMEVGTILSLVEADGTIVVQGTQGRPPLDEGSVLASHVKGSEASGTTEPLGRIHEIFGPCHTPHYTVKVEGAANKHVMMARFQAAKKQLVKAEKEQAQQAKAKAAPPIPRPTSADDPTGAAIAVLAESAEAEGTSPDNPAPVSTADMTECVPEAGGAKMAALRKAVCDAEVAMGEHKDHPFQRWKVGAKVYALKDHAKFLAKELLIPTGKGTDASNCHDEEADEEEFSDDEQERLAKLREKKDKKRSHMILKGVTPEDIASMEKEEEEQRRIVQERRQAERAANGDTGGRGGRGGRGARGGRGRGGRSDRGGGRRSGKEGRGGNSDSDANGAGYHGNGGAHNMGDGRIGNGAASSKNGWKANAQGQNSQAPYGNGGPPVYAPGGGMIPPHGHLQQGPPAGHIPAPFAPAHPFSARGPPPNSGAPGPNGQLVLQGPGGGYYPGFGAGAAGGFPHPQHQQPQFMSPPPMISNPSQYVLQQHQQQQQRQGQYQIPQQFQPQQPQHQQQQQPPYFTAGNYLGQNSGGRPMFSPPHAGSAPANGGYGPPPPGLAGTFPPRGHNGAYYSSQQ